MKYPVCLLFFFSFIQALYAQNFSYEIHVKSVTFSGDAMFSIRKDDGTGFYASDYHWKDDGTNKPAAFVSGSYVKAAAVFELICANQPADLYVRGSGPEGINFPPQNILLSGSIFQYPATAAEIIFEDDKIRYFENFSIHWEMSFDNVHWYDAGTSASTMYVTWQEAPPEETGFFANYQYFNTLFYLSCKNADGATVKEDIIAKVWSEFTDHSVLNADGLPLHYYKDLYSTNVFLPQLLKDRDGECYTWALLFLALLKINGISESNNYINIYNTFISTDCGFGYIDGFMVKDWTFGSPSEFCSDLPYLNVWNIPGYDDTSFIFIYEEVHDEVGILGQTEPNPNSLFGNHQLAIVGGKYYDACYGNVFDTFEDIKPGSISGWFYFDYKTEVQLGIDLNGDGDLDSSPGYSTMHSTNDIELTDFSMMITTF